MRRWTNTADNFVHFFGTLKALLTLFALNPTDYVRGAIGSASMARLDRLSLGEIAFVKSLGGGVGYMLRFFPDT